MKLVMPALAAGGRHAAHNGGLHDALRFGRLQRAAAGGKRVGQSPVHPASGDGREPCAYQKRAEKYGIETEVLSASDYSAPADIHGEAWRRVTDTIAEVFPGLAWSPYVMTGATDAKNYQAICDNCIRFAPVIYGPEQMRGMHGVNENIETACLPGAVDFYKALIGKNR